MKLLLHPRVEESLAQIAKQGRGSYLFYGQSNVGKKSAAIALAQSIHCPNGGDECAICTQVSSGNFPGVTVLEPAEGAKSHKIGIAQVQKLQEELSLSTVYGHKSRIVIVDLADNLTPESQNAMLKTLEEPPEKTILILLSVDPDLLLPTVRSRLQSVYFAPLPEQEVGKFLQDEHKSSSKDGVMAARLSRGRAGRAVSLANNSESREDLAKIASLAKASFEKPTFERMLLVPDILAADESATQYLDYLAAAVGRKLRDGNIAPQTAADYLHAVERCGRYIAANVSPKAALEGLMLQLEASYA